MAEKRISGKSDHDILITLVQTVNFNHERFVGWSSEVKTQLHNIESEIVKTHDGISLKVDKLEARVDVLEQWVHDYKLTWKTLLVASSTIATIVGFVLALISQSMDLFR